MEEEIDDILVEVRNGTYGLQALKALIDALPDDADIGALIGYVDEVEDLLKNATYGLSALKDEIDVNEAKIDALPTAGNNADGVWDEPQKDHVEAGSFGGQISTLIDYVDEVEDLLKNATYGLSALKDEIDVNETKINIVDSVVDAIKAVTDKLYTKNDVTPYYKVYPANANPTNLSSSATAWTYGSWAEIIAANTITDTFWIVGYLLIHEEAYNVHARLSIGTGASGAESEIFVVPYRHRYISAQGSILCQMVTLPIPYKVTANTRVTARIQDSQASARSYSVCLLVITGGI